MKYVIPFKATKYYAAGVGALTFHYGYGPQEFEIADISVVNKGQVVASLPAGTDVIALPTPTSATNSTISIDNGTVSTVPSNHTDFTNAYRVSTTQDLAHVYDTGMRWNSKIDPSAALNPGDFCMLTYYVRNIHNKANDSAIIKNQFVFEGLGANSRQEVTTNSPSDQDGWKKYMVPFKIEQYHAAGQSQLYFELGYGPQTFDIGGVSIKKYGPLTPDQQATLRNAALFYYPKRDINDPTATWRADANARIELNRRGSLTVNVYDKNWFPLKGANVIVNQTNHAFRFGSAIRVQELQGIDPSGDYNLTSYWARVTSHFNTSVIENGLKWDSWIDWAKPSTLPADQTITRNTLTAIKRLSDNDIKVRGHTIIWPSFSNAPYQGNIPYQTDENPPRVIKDLNVNDLRTVINAHINQIMAYVGLKGQIYQWDVLNEPYSNNDVQGLIPVTGSTSQNSIATTPGKLGNAEMKEWFNKAHLADPAAQLFLNDYDILESGGDDIRHQNYYYGLAKYLKNDNLQGLGMQGHFSSITPMDKMLSIILRFANSTEFSLPLAVTEFDVNTYDEQLQADYTRDVMTMVFSNAKFEDFLMWGFWEGGHWYPNAAMYRTDWTSKPNALVYNDLVYQKWWTNASANTGAGNTYTTPGYKGGYNVAATYTNLNGSVTTSNTITTTLDSTRTVDINLNMLAPSGYVVREYWNNVTSSIVSNIPTTTTPSGQQNLTSLEGPTNWADNYGDRIRGYIVAPTTGSYTFWIASDDNSEFWLSTNNTVGSKVLRSSVSGYTGVREWGKYPASQKSVAITLTAGQKYYFEVLHKDGTQGDHVAVGWAKPGQATTAPSEVIPGSALASF
jgi:endo-1,4-beta-xylanase